MYKINLFNKIVYSQPLVIFIHIISRKSRYNNLIIIENVYNFGKVNSILSYICSRDITAMGNAE